MHVICTAGHVDHGKSTLVRALTGMEPDRLAEERERGLTIDLGFAWAELEAAGTTRTLAFVDVPGHERFVGNMLAGAGAVDLAMLVVAADEGWMPQSQEHLDILDLLGVRRGLVAVTKADLVDPDTADLARELVRDELAATTLADAPIVTVSAHTGAGLDDLVGKLVRLLDSSPPAPDRGRPRLWVDRAFSISGAGTVVTGTLAGGGFAVGQEVAVLPGGLPGRIRRLQSLKQDIDAVAPGSRVAVNVAGVERDAVGRGDALGRPGDWLTVSAFDAEVRVLRGFRVGRRGAWHLHAGSARRSAELLPLGGEDISDRGMVRVELDAALPLEAGDRFILRETGRRTTVAGGMVLDPAPPPRPHGRVRRERRGEQLRERREALDVGDRAALLACHVAECGAADAARAAAAIGLDPRGAADAVKAHGLGRLGGWLTHPDAVEIWAAAIETALHSHHERHPVERTAPKDLVVRAAVEAGCPAAVVPALLDALVADARLETEGPGIRARGHEVHLAPEETAARDQLMRMLESEPFAPPRLSEAAGRAGASTALVRELEASGLIVRLDDDLAMTSRAVEEAVESLRAAFTTEGPLTAARAKQVLGTTRRYALPLLEHLDRTGRTRREGDARRVR